MYSFDILVIGGGPAGYSAAIHAAQRARRQGLSIGLVESRQLGGTCLNRGCIPTKTLLDTAGILDSLDDASKRGIELNGSASVDMKKVLQFKNRIVKKMSTGIAVLLRENGVPVIEGIATVSQTSEGFLVSVAKNGQTDQYTAKKLIFAAGSKPTRIPLPGLDDPDISQRILTSDELLDLDFVPEKLVVLGGGVIGVEASRIFRAFGSDVHLVEALPRLLPFLDTEIVAVLTKSLNSRKIKISTGVQAVSLSRYSGALPLKTTLSNGEEIEATHLLVAVGRSPNLDGLSPELTAALNPDRRGFLPVDARMQTPVAGFYAPGDVNGRCLLAHAAIEMGRLAAEDAVEATIQNTGTDADNESALEEYRRRILEKPKNAELPSKDTEFFPFYIPGCVYGEPEIGYLGWTEEQVRERFGDRIRVGRFPFAANGRAIAAGVQEGLAKVIRLADSNRVLGVHLIGPGASELINEASTVFSLDGLIDQWAATIHAHPTYGEAMAEAAADSLNAALHLPPRKVAKEAARGE